MEEYDFSITESDVAREVKNKKKVILMDTEIIEHLRLELLYYSDGNNRKYCRIVFIEINGITHVISTDSDHFSLYHVLIACAYSLMHHNCSINICGAGYLSVMKEDDKETILIDGSSGSFGRMNIFEIIELFKRLSVEIEINASDLSKTTKFHEYSYDQLLHMSQHIE